MMSTTSASSMVHGTGDGMMVGCDGLTDQWMDGMMDGTIDVEVLTGQMSQ